MSIREPVETDAAPQAIGPYSQAVRWGDLLFCSGAVPLRPDGSLVEGSIGDQASRCLANLEALAAASGSSLREALRLTIYTTRLERFSEINEACSEALPEPFPARAAVGVASLPAGAEVEIDAIIAIP